MKYVKHLRYMIWWSFHERNFTWTIFWIRNLLRNIFQSISNIWENSLVYFHLFQEKASDGCSPKGWPLCIGTSGIVIHLSPPDSSVVRNKDCYLSLRTRSLPGLEVALVWRKNLDLHFHTIAEFRNPLNCLDDIMCSSIKSVSDLEISSYDDYDGKWETKLSPSNIYAKKLGTILK